VSNWIVLALLVRLSDEVSRRRPVLDDATTVITVPA